MPDVNCILCPLFYSTERLILALSRIVESACQQGAPDFGAHNDSQHPPPLPPCLPLNLTYPGSSVHGVHVGARVGYGRERQVLGARTRWERG